MKKYAKIINEETKQCDVGLGTDTEYYISEGMTEMDVEQAYNGEWYVEGYAPEKPAPTYQEQRMAAYPQTGEQLDMIYWDRVNGTNVWQDTITAIKNKYPKN
ncbi:MAG: hypothetical protein ILP11_01040 [Alphaproteobacteria bacterium]|nr:hypothetical protein [Alphaproteobacteria bacterium]